jgi:osmotically inducible protein OsmC
VTIDVRYRTIATASDGRNSVVRSDDGRIGLKLSAPEELGGAGGAGTNSTQLFAAGFASCFMMALKSAGRRCDMPVSQDTAVTAHVGFGPDIDGGFGLTVDLEVSLPRMERRDAEMLIEQADALCSYSRATRGNVQVGYSLA